MNALALALSVLLSGHDDFLWRERATAVVVRLVKADPQRFGPAVSAASVRNESAEVRSRCGRATGPYRVWRADAYSPSTAPVWPCLDCCPLADVGRWGIVGEYRGLAGSPPDGRADGFPCWWGWRRACELYVRERVRDGWSYAEADEFVKQGWSGEERWIVRNTPGHLDDWRSIRGPWKGYPR